MLDDSFGQDLIMNVSLLTDQEKLDLSNQMWIVHDTYSRPIVIYQTAYQTVISTNPSTNILFDNAPFNSPTETIIQSGIFQARILYGKKEALNAFGSVQRNNASDQSMILLEEGEVRLRVDPTGAALLASSERVTFDNTIFNIQTSQRPHGLVGPPNFFDFYLKKIQ